MTSDEKEATRRRKAEAAWNAVKKYGGIQAAATNIGASRTTLGTQYRLAISLYGRADLGLTPGLQLDRILAESETPEARKDVRDAAFWRKRAVDLQRQLGDAEHVAEELAGVRNQPFKIPEWAFDRSLSKVGKSVAGLLLSDVHAGEVVDGDEILGLNAYNVDICQKRLRRLFTAACEVPQRWITDCKNQGFLLALGGDLISGDLHEELVRANEITSHEQVRLAVEEISAGIRHLKKAYGRVHVASVPGNHGRSTTRPTAKLYSRLNYDTLAANMMADLFRGDSAVTFQIGVARDAVIPILGHTVFLTHGDGMGTGGGQGFLGPMGPVVRGTKKVEAQQSRVNRRPDLILHGHFHTSANPGSVLSNGSVVGYSEYANGLRASVEPAQQWLFLLHSRWKLRERIEVQLEDPAPKELPRVRVPAAMA